MPGQPSPESWRRPLRISVRAVMAFVLITAGGLGWWIYRARVQQEGVAAIKHAGGNFAYSRQRSNGWPVHPNAKPLWADWVRRALGPDLIDTVTYVSLNGRRCDDEALRAASRFPWLEELIVEFTSVTDAGAENLGRLKNLRSLNLRLNEITGRPLRHIGELCELRKLRLEMRRSPVPLRGDDLSFLNRLTKLESLVLLGNGLTDTWLVYIEDVKNLRTFELDNMTITTESLHHLRGLTNLTALSLHDARVTGLEPLRALTKMTYLSLAYTPVADSALPFLQGWPLLSVLDLRRTNITDAGMFTLSGLSSLRELDLSQTKITDAGLALLAGSKSLRLVVVRETEVTDAAIAHFLKANALITVRW
jgi:internalin A